jgi:hypothetical protein
MSVKMGHEHTFHLIMTVPSDIPIEAEMEEAEAGGESGVEEGLEGEGEEEGWEGEGWEADMYWESEAEMEAGEGSRAAGSGFNTNNSSGAGGAGQEAAADDEPCSHCQLAGHTAEECPNILFYPTEYDEQQCCNCMHDITEHQLWQGQRFCVGVQLPRARAEESD